MPVIPATQEVEAGGSEVQARLSSMPSLDYMAVITELVLLPCHRASETDCSSREGLIHADGRRDDKATFLRKYTNKL